MHNTFKLSSRIINRLKETDKILGLMETVIERWREVPQRIKVVDREVNVKPHFISLVYRESDLKRREMTNGAFNSENGTENIAITGYSMNVMIGAPEQGFGSCVVARDEIPRDPKVIKNFMEYQIDIAMKTSLSSYLENLSHGLVVRQENGNGFRQLSDDAIAVHIEEAHKKENIPEDLIELTRKWTEIMSREPYILEANACFSSEQESRRLIDSQSRRILDFSTLSQVLLQVMIKHREEFYFTHSEVVAFNKGWSEIDVDMESKLEKISKHVTEFRNASSVPSDQYPVIFSGEAVGTLFHESLGAHLLSGKYIKHGAATTFKGQMGKLILPEFLTLIDDPQIPEACGYYKFDEEGIEGQRVVLVENGVLRNYLLDRDSAVFFGQKSNGHARRGWVMNVDENDNVTPIISEPRVSNLEIISSNSIPDDELIEMLKKYCKDTGKEYGLYIESESGSVDINTGEFHLFPSKAWKIFPDGGKEPIINFYVLGNPYELLKQMVVTGNTLKTTRGVCGAMSGGVPTQEIAPAAFIPKVTVQTYEIQKYTERLLK